MIKYIYCLIAFVSAISCGAASLSYFFPEDYNYLTAATLFPLPTMKTGSEHIVEVISNQKEDDAYVIKVKIVPDDIQVEYSFNPEGILLSAKAVYRDKPSFSVSLKDSRKELFPTNFWGKWPQSIEELIFTGLKRFTISRYLMDKKAGDKIVVHILAAREQYGSYYVDLRIGNFISAYTIGVNGVWKLGIFIDKDGKQDRIGSLESFNVKKGDPLAGKLAFFEIPDDYAPAEWGMLYFSPVKLKRVGYPYIKGKLVYMRVYDTSGKVIQDDDFRKVKPSPWGYQAIEMGEE